jgi:hypothetical protein
MPSRSKRLLVGFLAIVFALLACSLPGRVTPTPTPTTVPTPSLPVVASPQIVSFHMLDANNGWAVTDTNLLRTTDGGATCTT